MNELVIIDYGMNVAKEKLDSALVKYDAWFLILLAILMTVAFTIFAGLTIWCVVYQNKRFTGNWNWNQWGVSVSAECR